MKGKNKLFILLFMVTSVFTSCHKQDNIDLEIIKTRAAFDDYFEWDKVDKISIRDNINNQNKEVTLPWVGGSTATYNIPTEWYDENAEGSYSGRYYSRDNGWNLVYSNLKRDEANKYFALYNKNTGILRFFFYATSNASGGGNSLSYWGINVSNPSSMFNFTYSFSNSADMKLTRPLYVTTPPCVLEGSTFKGGGYQVNNWYGIEVECAYDPSITPGSGHYFNIAGWAANVTSYTGTGITQGTITGTIQNASPNLNINVGLENMFNNNLSEKIISIDQEGVVNYAGENIEHEISKNDGFFKGLWGNIKKQASLGIGEGVKSGLSTIISSGGSIAANALKGLASSVLGIGGKSVAKVDLKLSSTTAFNISGVTELPGWGGIKSLPVPGSANNVNYMPLYNKPIGVWNLKKLPDVDIEGVANDFHFLFDGSHYMGHYRYTYNLNCSVNDIVLNPEISNNVIISNFVSQLVYDENSEGMFGVNSNRVRYVGKREFYTSYPFAYIDGTRYYNQTVFDKLHGPNFLLESENTSYEYCRHFRPEKHGDFKVVISFKLVFKDTGKEIYFSRWFNINIRSHKVTYNTIDIERESDIERYLF